MAKARKMKKAIKAKSGKIRAKNKKFKAKVKHVSSHKRIKKHAIAREASSIVRAENKPRKEILTKKQVEDAIFAVAGENGVKIVDFLGDKKNVSEFIIADKLKIDMQSVRNTLYKMHTHNVVSYIRKKDRQKGWYISYWTFNRPRVRELIANMKKIQLEKLRERLLKEEANKGLFFICTKACARLDFDQATEFEFKCPECGTLLQQQENVRTIEHLKEKIQELETEM
jgi:transcription initiation factor TFIIE subunit alpha